MKIAEQTVELIDSMGDDIAVVNAARVSFHKESWWSDDKDEQGNQLLSEKDQKLISYLARYNHWTPFGHCFLSFRIKAPIFVARQLVKHQVGLVWNEVSRRYVDYEPEFWFPKEYRGRPQNSKQGSDGVIKNFASIYGGTVDHPEIECSCTTLAPTDLVGLCLDMYNEMLKSGVAPEQARIILPQNTMSEWIWSGSIAAFARVCKLRLDPHAQAETREVAEKIAALVPEEFKYSWKALVDPVSAAS